MRLKRILDVACLLLATSSVMDTYLWFTIGYHVPCWTIAVMSTALIGLLQAIKHLMQR